MPESFNDRSPTPSGSPKPAKLGGSQGAETASPTNAGKAAGGLENLGATTTTFQAADSRAQTSSLKRTGAAVDSFADATV